MTPATSTTIQERLTAAALYGFLVFEALTGPLRFYLSKVGLASVVYLPKALLAIAVLWYIVPGIVSGKGRASQFLTVLGVGFYVCVGAVYTGRPAQALFGLFSLVPLAAALIAENTIRRLRYSVVRYAAALWVVVSLGVVIDYVLPLPWVGASYEIGGAEVSGAKEWSTYGIERLAGFARASYSAAGQIFCLAIVVVALLRGLLLRAIVWLCSGVLILLTTTKTTFAAFALVTPLIPIVCLPGDKRGFTSLFRVTVPMILASIGIALPLSIFFVDYRVANASGSIALLLSSFEERLTWMWPDGFELVAKHGNWLLGRGIGGLGVAQVYYEPTLRNAGDNMFVFLYGNCGVMALVIIAVYTYRVTKLDVRLPWDQMIWLLSVAALIIGWAISAFEEPFVATVFGLTFAYARLHDQSAASAPHGTARE